MKRLGLAALLAALTACWAEVRPVAPVSFYDTLAPYGQWVEVSPYGKVWSPDARVVGADFYPYLTGGTWVSTDFGWQFDTRWPWGWIPFHHGRWMRAPSYGWVWVPGDEWAPAWVEWRVGGGNVGWVPLGPSGVTTYLGEYRPRWVFVPLSRLPQRDFSRYRLPAQQEYSAYRAATSIPFERGESRRGPSTELVRRAGAHVVTVPGRPPATLRRGDVRGESRLSQPAPPASGRRPVPSNRWGDREVRPMPPPPAAVHPSAPVNAPLP
jgi:hypothetical protein